MKAREIRFGNYVKDYLGLLVEFDIDCLMNNNFEELKPIPIAKELLFIFNFRETHIKGSYIYKMFRFHTQRPNDEDKFTLVTEIYFNERQILLTADLKYFHQLQNLYFALTGNELTLKK